MKEVSLNASDAFKGATFTIDVRVRTDWRMRLGVLLLRAAAWVLRCNFRVADAHHGQ